MNFGNAGFFIGAGSRIGVYVDEVFNEVKRFSLGRRGYGDGGRAGSGGNTRTIFCRINGEGGKNHVDTDEIRAHWGPCNRRGAWRILLCPVIQRLSSAGPE